jgi:iron complex outermembrane receptor protein
MEDLYGPVILDENEAIDSFRCVTRGAGDPVTGRDPDNPSGAGQDSADPCVSSAYPNVFGGNRDLDPEESTQWNLGFVWNPTDDLSLAVDWYDIELENEIRQAPELQPLLDREYDLRRNGDTGVPFSQGGVTGVRVGQVVRSPGNLRPILILNPNSNLNKRETDGLDVEGSYTFALGRVGDFRTAAVWSYVHEYEVDDADGRGLRSPEFFDPRNRGVVSLDWALGDFGASLVWNYIASASYNDANGVQVAALDSYETWDLGVSYSTPWNGTLTLGARNLFDEDPPTSEAAGGPNYSNYLHDVYGRVPYVRYEQDL